MLWLSANNYFKEKFGEKVHRVAVDAGFTCPNRDGTKGVGGCLYCDEGGARAAYVNPEAPVSEQIRLGIERISKRFKAEKFIAYFQAYSNTYTTPERLFALLNETLAVDSRIVGIALGTRADCLNNDILDVLSKINKRTFMWVEFGLQTIRQDILDKLNRCDSVDNFISSMEMMKNAGLKSLAHIIFGLPGEHAGIARETANLLNSCNIWGAKIHALYLTKTSDLGKQYLAEPFNLSSLAEYVDKAVEFLEYLNPETVIHRITSDVSPEKLVAPTWIMQKQNVISTIESSLVSRGSRQGSRFVQ